MEHTAFNSAYVANLKPFRIGTFLGDCTSGFRALPHTMSVPSLSIVHITFLPRQTSPQGGRLAPATRRSQSILLHPVKIRRIPWNTIIFNSINCMQTRPFSFKTSHRRQALYHRSREATTASPLKHRRKYTQMVVYT